MPIILVAITGTENALNQLLHWRKLLNRVQFGQSFCLPPINRHNRGYWLQRNTDEIMCRIAVILPPTYRGVYADHQALVI